MASRRIIFGGPRSAALLGAVALTLLSPARAAGQETGSAQQTESGLFPSHGFLLSGYGSAGYNVSFEDDETPNNFVASLNPVLLFQISDRFLFEAELEFELEEGVTETRLEYAQIDYSLTNNLKFVAGKFLLPFNIFSERLHPAWITRFATLPPLYGHGLGPGPTAPLVPILTDVGIQLRGAFNLGKFGYLTAAAFVTQGPRLEADEHGEEGAEEGDGGDMGMEELEIPEVAFGTNFADNNKDKMVGGRLGVGIAPYVEVNLSAMRGDYDDEGRLSFTAFGAHLELRHRSLELHSEWIRTEQQVLGHEDPTEVMTLARDGYFARLGYRIGKWEPLVRWTQIFAGKLGGETAVESGQQLTLAVAYWLRPSLVLKGEYSFNYEDADVDNNRLAVQWAFGF